MYQKTFGTPVERLKTFRTITITLLVLMYCSELNWSIRVESANITPFILYNTFWAFILIPLSFANLFILQEIRLNVKDSSSSFLSNTAKISECLEAHYQFSVEAGMDEINDEIAKIKRNNAGGLIHIFCAYGFCLLGGLSVLICGFCSLFVNKALVPCLTAKCEFKGLRRDFREMIELFYKYG